MGRVRAEQAKIVTRQDPLTPTLSPLRGAREKFLNELRFDNPISP
jgi:hypothetical protein